MLHLYHCANARSFRVLWLLEELGISYELHVMQFPPRHHAPDYLALNPQGTVPYLVDGDTTLSESIAILQYLDSVHGQGRFSVAPGQSAYASWLNWLLFGEASLMPPLATILRYRLFAPEEGRNDAIAAAHETILSARLEALESALTSSEYLCAAGFSTADISVGYALLLARVIGLGHLLGQATDHYWQRLERRPAFRAAFARQTVR
jgi:glutathione S-transferase